MSFERIICVDFDGVIHSYSSGWKGVDVIPDKPVDGAFDFLMKCHKAEGIRAVIYSFRSKDPKGVDAMKAWFKEYGVLGVPYSDDAFKEMLKSLEFPTQKPAAWLTIDDRAICFEGNFPTLEVIRDFKPWNRCAGCGAKPTEPGSMQYETSSLCEDCAYLMGLLSGDSKLNRVKRLRRDGWVRQQS